MINMKILLINKYHYLKGGAERAYFDMAELLKAHGHEVAFFSMQHPQNEPTYWSKYFVDNIDYNENNLNIFKKIKASLNIIYNFQAKRNLGKLIDEFHPDVAHLHNVYHQLSFSIVDILKKKNIPMAMTLHDYKLVSPNYSLYVRGKIWEKTKNKKYYYCLLDKCIKNSFLKSLICTIEAYFHELQNVRDKIDLYISPSIFLKEKFKEFGFKKQIEYLPNPLLFSKIENGIFEKENDFLLYFGRLAEEKGVDDLIRAFAYSGTNSKLKIIGDGPKKEELEKLKQELKQDNIEFTGFLYEKDLWDNIKKAKAIIVPSGWYENAPYSVIEAMYLKKAIIAPAHGGLKELIESGETGVLYQPGNINELSGIIKNLNNYNILEIGESARKKVLNMNDPDKFYFNLIKLYRGIIKIDPLDKKEYSC